MYYFHNDPIYEEHLAVQMACVANDARLSLPSQLMIKRKADHISRSTVDKVQVLPFPSFKQVST